MIRPRDEDNKKPDPKRIKLVSSHPPDGPNIIAGAGSPTNKRDESDDTGTVLLVYLIGRPQARSVSRSANAQNGCESNSGPSDTSTMGPDRKPEDSDSEGPSDEILRRCEEVRALKARAKQRREDRERIHGPPIPPSPPQQFTPEEWKIIRKRQPKRRAAMQLLLIAARAAFDSFDNLNGSDDIVPHAASDDNWA
ncbi:hypothetical protein BC826DRAFT_974365 [Russula brevipes]|nr:hypothetical protein BC826DRAFT_974365 [Russula brevipes]